jgi:uncharacterized membrane protein YoaK (UPF0700 family)
LPLAFAFAAIAGYADAVGYLRAHAFAGMMTGNTVLMGLAFLRRADLPAYDYAAILALFFVVSAIGFAALRLRCPPLVLLLAEGAAIVAAGTTGAGGAIIFLVIAMGLQNPLATRLGLALSTTFITGDILRFAEGLVGRRVRPATESRASFAVYGIAWLGYAVGATLGAAGFALLPLPLLVPAATLGYVYWHARVTGKLSTSGQSPPPSIKL